MSVQRTLSRRGFIGAGAGLAAAAAVGTRARPALGTQGSSTAKAPSGDPPLIPADRIGIQLYSVRDQVSSIGFAKVFETLAKLGYKQVEFAGYTQGTTPEITTTQIRKLMDANGLTGIGSHVSPSDDASMEQILDDAEILGLPQVGISLVVPSNTTVSGWQQTADTYNHYGSLAAKRGKRFYLHNHFQEWALTTDDPTRRGEDVLLAETDPALVWFEMDIYWAYVGQFQSGQVVKFDPLLDYAVPYRSRYLLFHVKDGKKDESGGYADALDDIVDVGEGNIDFATFFSTLFHQAAGEQTRHWYIQERDNASSHARGSLVASQCSYLYMRYGIVGR